MSLTVARIVGGAALVSTLVWAFTGVTLWVPLQTPIGETIVPFAEFSRGAALVLIHAIALLWWAFSESGRP